MAYGSCKAVLGLGRVRASNINARSLGYKYYVVV